jgi:predicted O-linked N-acetylglucosamine transferase (SPINDLY family)
LALQKQGQLEAAEQVYLELIADHPDYAAAHQHLGNLYQQRQQFPTAITYYQQAIQHQPQLAIAWCNLGVALQAIGETQQAKQAFQQALEINPNYVEAHNGLGAAYEKQELAVQAIQSYQQALALQPTYLPALTNLGNIQLRLEQFSAAEATYRQILQLQPHNVQILDNYVKLHLTTCNWSELPDWIAALQQAVQAELRQDNSVTCSPLNSLFLPYSAAEQQMIAQHYAAAIDRRMAGLRQQLQQETERAIKEPDRRIRLGYVSGDFRYHAVGQLILRLFELHDRQSFEIFAYSFSPDDGSPERQKLIQDCDCFRDVQNCMPLEAARQVIQDEIDILIDLAGYTNYACPELLALRPAPLQINYLGYPGSLGATYIDYVITDAVITPPELAATLTETCFYLPDTYQINCYPYPGEARTRLDATAIAQLKQQNGLPTNAFIFCCFNKSQKIEPTMFAVWMRILQQVPQSVLWLLSERPETEQNLRAAGAN